MKSLPTGLRALVALAGTLLGLAGTAAAQGYVDPGREVGGQVSTKGTPPGARIQVTPRAIDFGVLHLGEVSPERTFQVTNVTGSNLKIQSLDLLGQDAGDFVLSTGLPSGGVTLAPGKSATFGVTWTAGTRGGRSAIVRVDLGLGLFLPNESVGFAGSAIGPAGSEILLDAGGGEFVDHTGTTWAADYGHRQGLARSSGSTVTGTSDPELYQTQRQGLKGLDFSYHLLLKDAGTYAVTLDLAETRFAQAGARLFDVLAEGALVLDDYDLFVAAGGKDVAHQETFLVDVEDGVLDLDFVGVVRWPLVHGIEVRGAAHLAATPTSLAFGAVASGDTVDLPLQIQNDGVLPATIDTVSLLLDTAGTPEAFSLALDGQTFQGATGNTSHSTAITLAPGETKTATVTFAPTAERYDSILLSFSGDFGTLDVPASGLGGHEGDPYLHVVIVAPPVAVDYDADGSEAVTLDGTGSHTHEPGRSIVAWEWRENGQLLGTSPVQAVTPGLGSHTYDLTIYDDGTPVRSLTGSFTVDVTTAARVPGVWARYYDATGTTASSLLDAVPAAPSWTESRDDFEVPSGTKVGGSPFAQDVMVQLVADVDVDSTALYQFAASGGAGTRLELDGQALGGPQVLATGTYTLEARFAVDSLADLPLSVTMSVDGGPAAPIDASLLTHDETPVLPFIDAMPGTGTTAGGNTITIDGFGFFPSAQVVVNWGGTVIPSSSFQSITEPDQIVFLSPPGTAGTIQVSVTTPNGTSNLFPYVYDDGGPVPISFDVTRTYSGVPQGTAAVWGPDGHLYVAALDGRISELTFGDDWTLTSLVVHTGVSLLDNHDVCGIAVSPWDPPGPVRLYVSHGEHFLNGGSSFSGPSPYTGEISTLDGPSFDTPVPLITGLPTSNHDHGMNGIVFDDNGDLLIALGGNTNAGVKHPNSGDLPESPLSGAILKARLSDPAFDGAVAYADSATGVPDDDQVYGESVDQVGGLGVEVQASGLRNPFGLVYTTGKRLFCTDNGPNIGFGAASTGATTEDPDPYDVDEIDRVEWGNYYGHPNRSRGRTDPRQYVYRNATQGDVDIPGEFTQAAGTLPSSSDGIVEYTADTFQGQMRGDLLVQQWNSKIQRVEMDAQGRHATAVSDLATVSGLGLVQGPGGALLSLDYSSSRLRVLEPQDASATGLKVFDVIPTRAPATGGAAFVIGGVGFGTLADTTVSFGGRAATLTRVSSNRIEGLVPVEPAPGTAPVDVVVTVGTTSSVHAGGFRYLFPQGTEPGTWDTLPGVPAAIGEVAAAEIGGKLYVVGEGSAQTFVFDLVNQVWLPSAAPRPYAGDHHAAEVVGGKLYLVGGLDNGSEGTVQIYDPATDAWSLGASMPWDAGSVATAVIDGKIYAAGGIVSAGYTVPSCGVYDPAADAWTSLAPMPQKRNHAASATDGQELFVFGGRTGGNFVTNGFDDTQIYDPVTDTWQASSDAGSTLKPLPEARGGMGTAVWFRGEFYVFGGETLNDPDAIPGTNVYDRVDVYDPVRNTWRLEAPMPTPRHGIYPVLWQGRMFLAGGGTQSANSQSSTFDEFTRQ